MKSIFYFSVLMMIHFVGYSQSTVFTLGSAWKYLDNGSNQNTSWRLLTYNDAAWKTGNAEFGYGDGDEATVVSYGTNASNKYITTYFRKSVFIANPEQYSSFSLSMKRDDGAVIYINGNEVWRSNMPSSSGTITYTTLASNASDDGATVQTGTIPTSAFVAGNNIVAVEIHQSSRSSSDVTFDMQLVAMNANGNQSPLANAGTDQTITLPTSSVILSGSGSDTDGSISSYVWTSVSGPTAVSITSPSAASTSVTGLTVAGTYVLRLTVTDNVGATAVDNVNVVVNPALSGPLTLMSWGSSWKYLDNGTNQGTGWRGVGFNDTAWPSGLAELGYADSPVTTLSYGPVSNNKYITYYFRKLVNFTDPASYAGVTLNIRRDDGAVVYVNGTEVYRSNLPSGAITYTTLASNASDDGATVQTGTIPTSAFVAGNNIVAVEIHQSSRSSSDVTFDMQLVAMNANGNQSPLANAGTDQTIILPTSSVILSGSGSDTDGSISSYVWTSVSGPTAVSITSPSAASTSVTGLTVAGTYVLRLTVTDNVGATAVDNVNVVVNPALSGPLTLMSWGSSWKYLDNGTNQGTGWRGVGFNDTAWPSGLAELGYADSPVTTLSYGPVSNNKYITYYFRKLVNFTDPASYAAVTLNIRRDDGAVVYVNGTEVYRSNLPSGTITYTTLASNASDDGATVQTGTIPISAFVAGNNIVAVEIHQSSASSSDVTFDMQLVANNGAIPVLTRGPYLQMANETSVTLRWRTNVASNSKIEVGSVFGTYNLSATNATSATEHEIRISGLTPDTKYYYRFGSSTSILQATTANYFMTAPPATTTRKIRVAAFGDCGTSGGGNQASTLTAYQNYTGANPAELMLLLGDNAYNNGTDSEYQTGFFNAYSGTILKNHILFPAPGNHEYANTTARQIDKNIAYYNIFTLPILAESGGVPSSTESYYSYNWGNIHFISLDSYGMETSNNLRLYDTLSPQVTWLKQDLAANTKKWTIAYWHHPPFTMGSHNSDTETELVSIRQNFIRILERNGVDMILCGHSHDYERSYLLKGYYSNEASFNLTTHAVSSSSGKYDGSNNSCALQTTSNKENHGTVYVVSGSAGNVAGVQAGYPHNALPFAFNDGGMFYFEVEDNRLDAKFIRRDGVIADQFTIMKDVGNTTTVNINPGQNTTLTASWKGTYNWSTGATTRSITVNPTSNTTYTCTDDVSCIVDQFMVTTSGASAARVKLDSEPEAAELLEYSVFPIPVKRGEHLIVQGTSNHPFEISIMNTTGTVVRQLIVEGTLEINTSDMASGLYYIIDYADLKSKTKKFVILE